MLIYLIGKSEFGSNRTNESKAVCFTPQYFFLCSAWDFIPFFPYSRLPLRGRLQFYRSSISSGGRFCSHLFGVWYGFVLLGSLNDRRLSPSGSIGGTWLRLTLDGRGGSGGL
jgi:hypothetical protein